MPLLIGWKVLNMKGYSVLVGRIYGDQHIKNGTFVVTSIITYINTTETIARTLDKDYILRFKA